MRTSLPTRFFSSEGLSPPRSEPGAGSSVTCGSRSSTAEARCTPNFATSSALRSSLNALPVMENAAMRLRQSSGVHDSGWKPAS